MRRCILAAVAASTALAIAPATTQAFDLTAFDVGLTGATTAAEPVGPSLLTAGAHPNVTVNLEFPTTTDDNVPSPRNPNGNVIADQSVKTVDVDLPRGLIFNPTAVPACPEQLLSAEQATRCPTASQVGRALIRQSDSPNPQLVAYPLYNMVPPPGVPAQFGFNIARAVIKINGAVRTGGDYGLSSQTRNISQGLSLGSSRIEFWGVPADPIYDDRRTGFNARGFPTPGTAANPVPAGIPARPFTSNPGRCTGEPLQFSAVSEAWESPGVFGRASASTQRSTGEPLVITGCESLPFEPSVTVRPTTTAPDSPTGLDVTVNVAQTDSPELPSAAHLKDLSVLLPEGMNVNPSAAEGLTACTPAQIDLAGAGPAACPDTSILGTVSIDTPLLEQPLVGRAFLASQNDNPFGTTLAMYLAAEGSGVVVKLPGRIDADPATGRLRVTFADNPELPFRSLTVSLQDGPLAPLTTPAACGPQEVSGSAVPWSGGAAVPFTDGFTIDCVPGLGGFAPAFTAGTVSPAAGQFSPLTLSIARPDGQQQLKDLTIGLPPGLLARIDGVPLCGEAQAAAGTCDAASRVGTASVTAGAGARPFPLAGPVSLTGPYRGAPYGLSTSVRVIAGPLDLGTVVVRQALFIDSEDARVTAVSDPLPTILSGIPIRLRALDIALDRPGFTVNPTSCAVKAIGAAFGSIAGAQAPGLARFQAGGCAALPVSPRLSMRLAGRRSELRRDGHPGVIAQLNVPPGQAGLRRVEARLPLSLALDPDNAQELCSAEVGSSRDPGRCPAGSRIGTASASSPLLPEPLTGPVYFVQGLRTTATGQVVRTLPRLVMPLRGNGIQLNVRANSLVRGNRLVAQFDELPDAPISRFDFRIFGGDDGVLVAVREPCRSDRRAALRFRGHSNRLTTRATRIAMRCGRGR